MSHMEPKWDPSQELSVSVSLNTSANVGSLPFPINTDINVKRITFSA